MGKRASGAWQMKDAAARSHGLSCAVACYAFLLLARLAMAQPPSARTEVAVNPRTGAMLADEKDWIRIKDKSESEWKRLIPGHSPQWHLDGDGFYYFLDVGYDGNRSELWSANSVGEDRIRLTRSDYFINRHTIPVVSPDARHLAYLYGTCRASGGFSDVIVVDLIPGYEAKSEGKVVFRAKSGPNLSSLRWIDPSRLEVTVDGTPIDVDATVPGMRHVP